MSVIVPAATTLLSAATTTGAGSTLNVTGNATVGLQVTITGGTATVAVEGIATGSTPYTALPVTQVAAGAATQLTAITATGLYLVPVAGLETVRPNVTAVSGATVTVVARPNPHPNPLAGSTSGTVTVQGAAGGTPAPVVGVMDNPASTLTRPADTTAYAAGDSIASSTTAGSVVVPSVTVARVAAGSLMVRRVRLSTNKASGWGAVVLRVTFWAAAPTYAVGDNAAYAAASVSTGGAGYLGQCDVTLTQWGDAASGIGVPAVGSEIGLKLASGQVIYWDLQVVSGTPTPASGQTFSLIPECYQN